MDQITTSTTGTGTTHPVVALAREVDAGLDAVAEVDPIFMPPSEQAEALLRLTRLGTRLEALRLRLIQASGPVADIEGHRDVAAWLTDKAREDKATAGGAQRLARRLADRWTVLGEHVATGSVSVAQARVIVRSLDILLEADGEARREGATGVPAEVFDAAEAHLVELAARHTPTELRRLGSKILSVVAPHIEEDLERRAIERAERDAETAKKLTLRRRGDGSTDLKARVPDHVAARLKTYLDAFTSPRTESGQRAWSLVDEATGERMLPERRDGEAFCALLESLDPAQLPLHGGSPTAIMITIDLDQLQQKYGSGVLEDGTRISVSELRRQACNAGIIPAVLDGESTPLDLGRKQRLFSGAQKLALALQQPTCRAAGCRIPASWCEAHHAKDPWAAGGRTDLADGMLLCSWHHHRAHDPTYRTKHTPDGDLRFHRRT